MEEKHNFVPMDIPAHVSLSGLPHFLQIPQQCAPRTYPNISSLGVRDACWNGISHEYDAELCVLRDSRSKVFFNFRETVPFLFSPLNYSSYQQLRSKDSVGTLKDSSLSRQ